MEAEIKKKRKKERGKVKENDVKMTVIRVIVPSEVF